MSNQKRENKFRTELCDAIKGRWGSLSFTQKHHGNEYSAGLVDMLVKIADVPATAYVELKAVEDLPIVGKVWDWSKGPTSLQLSTLMNIHRAGGNARVLLYVKDLERVYARSAKFVWECRGGALIGVSRVVPSVWTVEGLQKEQFWWPWDGDKTDEATLRQMLFEAVP